MPCSGGDECVDGKDQCCKWSKRSFITSENSDPADTCRGFTVGRDKETRLLHPWQEKVSWLNVCRAWYACSIKFHVFTSFILVSFVGIGIGFSALMLFVGWQEGHLACK